MRLKIVTGLQLTFDAEHDIAMQLTEGKGVPQLIMFEKRDGKWVRRRIAGYKDANTVEAFVAQSPQLRMAQLTQNEVNAAQNK